MKIGDISKRSGIPVETVRYYEKIGLLPEPQRNANGYRSYSPAHLDRLLFIKRCRNLDMAQDEIRELIRLAEQPEADCSDVDALLARHLNHVRERLKELQSLEQTLLTLQAACADSRTVRECGILDGLNADLEALDPKPSHTHVPGTHRRGNH
ncbi:Cd(II)/Pb(II)-responsive transcriptional regulator [Marinobacter koreensis]|uniref:Cd(II)/Pb(II)-responsive transcriptional regulator n=1 Tax=Marinobacter koreensis TaxID=335974 RepID=A0ABW0RLW2_9GAMM|nr:Cd(II)/Pb(II)-responsive transcriptional regulator [Marinobacter koreensis]MCK7546530.1 Cd(II)/Pb(II)-responsive transcriptional regulator [Marinobacter koreensis]MDX1818371.1 Cd(II)/Pb(II)-responsive transcriptional regulator [Marinobacter sp.]